VPKTLRSLFASGVLFLVGLGLTACIISTDSTEPTPEQAIPLLLNLLKGQDPEQRRTAAQSLGKIGRKETLPALIEATNDSDPGVRRQAAWALGAIGDEGDATHLALISLLFDANADVRETAALALAQTEGSPAILQVLKERLDAPGTSNDTKRLAAEALAGMAIPGSTGVVAKLLQDQDPVVRRWAIAAMAETAGQEAVAALTTHLKKDPDPGVRIEAAFRLARIGDAAALSALTDALHDPDEHVRRIAQVGLQESKEKAS
jgi:HEAT repeat protein